VASLMGESEGVTGLHLNGEVATWDWLLANEWLADFNEAMNEIIIMISEQLENDQDQHEIRMTDDPIYRDHFKKVQRRKEIEEHGIDEN
jgi:hypothetical protein